MFSFATLYSLHRHVPIFHMVFYIFPLALTSGVGRALRDDIKQWLRRRLGTPNMALISFLSWLQYFVVIQRRKFLIFIFTLWCFKNLKQWPQSGTIMGSCLGTWRENSALNSIAISAISVFAWNLRRNSRVRWWIFFNRIVEWTKEKRKKVIILFVFIQVRIKRCESISLSLIFNLQFHDKYLASLTN